MSAVILLQEMMLRKKLDPQSCIDDELEEQSAVQNKDTNKDKVAVLAIAYHNMGVEQEFLRSYPAAILSYKKAVNFAEKNLGPDDGITQNLRSVYENAKNEVSIWSQSHIISFRHLMQLLYLHVTLKYVVIVLFTFGSS
jgi:hypothetical protein